MGDVGLEDALDSNRRVCSVDIAVQLPPQALIRTEAAADMDVIALDGVAVLRDRHPGPEQADVADIVLGAGIRAAGKMDVDRDVKLQTRFAPVSDVLGVALGVGKGETTAGIAGTGDETGANRCRLCRKAQLCDRRFGRADTLRR